MAGNITNVSYSFDKRHKPGRCTRKKALSSNRYRFLSSLARLPISLIVDAFPEETSHFVPKEIKRLKKHIKPYTKWVDLIYQSEYDEFAKWFLVQVSLVLFAPVKELEYLCFLEKIQKYIKNKDKYKNEITQKHIMQAKDVPIQSFFEGTLRQSSSKLFGLCPFHQEKKGSFIINLKDNTWHCFGACSEHGDSISFVMKLYNTDFISAVKFLLNIS